MLSKENNELVTRIGPGTPMGEVMRRYWVPALVSEELPEPDCPPVRVKLLGEKLVAFRDTDGHVGLLDEFCAHRRASLFLGRNEECGLRCVYHGWKYDVDGNCVEMPNEPPESNFKDKIHLKAYPTVELGDTVWAYMGPKEKTPPLPKFEWTQVPESHRLVAKTWLECNWLVGVEGVLDTVHVIFLHRDFRKSSTDGARKLIVQPATLNIEIDETDYGFIFWSNHNLGEGRLYARAFQYIMPFHTFLPFQVGNRGETVAKPEISGLLFVPMDDENTMVYNVHYHYGEGEPAKEEWYEWVERRRGRGPGEQTADFRKVRNKDNDWMIDRRKQKTGTFTGIEGINVQDHAIEESMGPIVDRTREHLVGTDRATIAARKMLMDAAMTVQNGGSPRGVGPSYYGVRSIERVVPPGANFRELLKDEISPRAQDTAETSA